MRNTPRAPRIFLDTSVLLSGLNSSTGASAAILALSTTGKIALVISPEVLDEARSVIADKFPLLGETFFNFLASEFELTKPITNRELQRARRFLSTEDAPILAGALKARAHLLVTLDKEFYCLAARAGFITMRTPAEFMKQYRSMRP